MTALPSLVLQVLGEAFLGALLNALGIGEGPSFPSIRASYLHSRIFLSDSQTLAAGTPLKYFKHSPEGPEYVAYADHPEAVMQATLWLASRYKVQIPYSLQLG